MPDVQQSVNWAICHYEDEPQRVDFPDLIEYALFQHEDVALSDIYSDNEMCLHKITFQFNGQDHSIYYAIYPTVEEMFTFLSDKELDCTRVLLNIVDLSINGDREMGISIVKDIKKSDGNHDIWFLTGYPVDTQRLLDENGLDIRIISKPANHRLVCDNIMEVIFGKI